MALFKTIITRVTGRGTHLFDGVGEKLFNGEGVYELQESGITRCSFMYALNMVDDESDLVRIESRDDIETIRGYINDNTQDTFTTLYVFPNQDRNLATEEEAVLTKNISLVYDIVGGSIMYLIRGTELERLICSNTVNELLTGVTTTSTSTTSTSTTTTPTTTTGTTTTGTTTTGTTTTGTTTTSTTSTTSTTTTTLPLGDTVLWDDGVDYFRLQVRDDVLFLDQTITPTGFEGDEDTDWGNIWEQSLPESNFVVYSCTYEDGVGDKVYVQFGPSGSRGVLDDSEAPNVDRFALTGVADPPVTFESAEINQYVGYSELVLTIGEEDTIGPGDTPILEYEKGGPGPYLYEDDGTPIDVFSNQAISPV